MFAVSALLVSCGESQKCESTCDSTKTCCKESTVIFTDSALVDSATTAVKDTLK